MSTQSSGSPRPTSNLDDVDRSILALLSVDARLSHREIARRVGMSPGAISDRIQRLEASGVIRGYHADIDAALFGLGTRALVGLQVVQGGAVDETMERLGAIPEVGSVWLVTGQWDFIVEMEVRDQDHLRDVLIGEIWELPVFRHSESMVVLSGLAKPPSRFAAGDYPGL